MMNETLAYIHFAVTFVGAYLIFGQCTFRSAGVPRRYYSFSEVKHFRNMQL